MNYKKKPTFSFSKPFAPKTLNITYKKSEDRMEDDIDICDEIDSLLSDFSNLNNENSDPYEKKINNDKSNEIIENSVKKENNFEIEDYFIDNENEEKEKFYKENLNEGKKEDFKNKEINEHKENYKDNELNLMKDNNKYAETQEEKENHKEIEIKETKEIIDKKDFEEEKENHEYDEKNTKYQVDNGKNGIFNMDVINPLNSDNTEKKVLNLITPEKPIVSDVNNFDFMHNEQEKNNASENQTFKNFNVRIILKTLETEFDKVIAKNQENELKIFVLNQKNDLLNNELKYIYDKHKQDQNNNIKKRKLQIELDFLKEKNEIYNCELNGFKTIIQNLQEDKNREINKCKIEFENVINEKKNLVEESININKKFQNEIDFIKKDLYEKNKEIEHLQEENNQKIIELEETNQKNLNLEDEIIKKENEKNFIQEALNKCTEKIISNNDIFKNKIKELEKKSLIIDQITEINKSFKKEIEEFNLLKNKIKSYQEEIENTKINTKRLEDENIVFFEENKKLKLTNNKLIEKINYLTEMNEKKKIKNIGNKHNINLKLKIIFKKHSEIIKIFKNLNDYKNKNVHKEISDFYQSLFAAEMKKFQKEKADFNTKLQILALENKKCIKQNNIKILNTKFVEPSDSDIWNVFN